jgi:hypothetical protein
MDGGLNEPIEVTRRRSNETKPSGRACSSSYVNDASIGMHRGVDRSDISSSAGRQIGAAISMAASSKSTAT